MDRTIAILGKGTLISLWGSIFLLGFGRLESSLTTATASTWSISRTTFFVWLLWKLLIWIRCGSWRRAFRGLGAPAPLVFFFICVTSSLLPDFHGGADYRYFFFASMHYVMILDLFAEEKRSRILLLSIALLPGLLVIRGILYDPSVLQFAEMRRFGYPLSHPNTAGYLFALSIPLALGVAAVESARLRLLALSSFAGQLLGLVLTYSRGAWLGTGAALLALALSTRRWKEIGVIAAACLLVLFFAPPLQNRLMSLGRPQSDPSIEERLKVMTAGVRLGFEHPLLGAGYGRDRLREGLKSLGKNATSEIFRVAHTHNVYVELFAETGVLGLAAFLWLLADALYKSLSQARRAAGRSRLLHLSMAAAWIAFAVTGLGDVPFYHHEVRIFFFTMLALTHLRCVATERRG